MLGLASRKKRAAADKGAAEKAAPEAVAPEAVQRGTVAIVSKGAERIPVQLRDAAHLEQLRATYGAKNVEVQS